MSQSSPIDTLDTLDSTRLRDVNSALASSIATVTCPRCTFHNHSSLLACEICGAPLADFDSLRPEGPQPSFVRSESPGPQIDHPDLYDGADVESVKFSFRGGGEKLFQERLKDALLQRQWLLRCAPPIPGSPQSLVVDHPSPGSGLARNSSVEAKLSAVGIAGLERRGIESRQKNEAVIGNAFEDLKALIASAKDVVKLAEQFASDMGRGTNDASSVGHSVASESAAVLGMITTKDTLNAGSDDLYVSELSRNLAEYLTDDKKSVLQREGGIMSLVDLWAVVNRSRNGVELISPSDFEKAARLWEKLGLPVRLRRFRSGVLVVQRNEWNDEKIINQFVAWLRGLHGDQNEQRMCWDARRFGRGVTVQEVAQRFGWSVGVAVEELEMAEDHGVLCREEGIEGLKFWENHFKSENEDPVESSQNTQ